MNSARARIVAFWDAHVQDWLEGRDELPAQLSAWHKSYSGTGVGAVTHDGFPEPFQGDLLGVVRDPRMVVLGLNPGQFRPCFQARDGIFADEIRQHGSYSGWMRTCPYDRAPWTDLMGPNRYYRARLRFTRNWLDDPSADHHDLLIFECYPWHSTSVTGPLRPPPEIIDEFVWQPIAELPVRQVFAFGRPWHDLAETLGLPLVLSLGAGGVPYGSTVPSRAVRVHALPSGQQLVVEWHAGGAGPPCLEEVRLLRDVLAQLPPDPSV